MATPPLSFAMIAGKFPSVDYFNSLKELLTFLIMNRAEPHQVYQTEMKICEAHLEVVKKEVPLSPETEQRFKSEQEKIGTDHWFFVLEECEPANIVAVGLVISGATAFPHLHTFCVATKYLSRGADSLFLDNCFAFTRHILEARYMTADPTVHIGDLRSLVRRGFCVTHDNIRFELQKDYARTMVTDVKLVQTEEEKKAQAVLNSSEKITPETFMKRFGSTVDSTGITPVVIMIKDLTK